MIHSVIEKSRQLGRTAQMIQMIEAEMGTELTWTQKEMLFNKFDLPEPHGRFLTLYEREQLHKKIEHTKARKSETARKKAAKRQRKANRK